MGEAVTVRLSGCRGVGHDGVLGRDTRPAGMDRSPSAASQAAHACQLRDQPKELAGPGQGGVGQGHPSVSLIGLRHRHQPVPVPRTGSPGVSEAVCPSGPSPRSHQVEVLGSRAA